MWKQKRGGWRQFPIFRSLFWWVTSLLFCGLLCALLRLRGAYRFAAITLSIVLLIAHQRPAWIVASHRFVEVSVGIAVALALAEIWPSRA